MIAELNGIFGLILKMLISMAVAMAMFYFYFRLEQLREQEADS